MENIADNREQNIMKVADLKASLNIPASTLSQLIKNLKIDFIEDDSAARGKQKNLSSTSVRKLLESRGFSYPKATQVISIMMGKGGVGKTTTSVFLAHRLADYGARVLLIDADPQGNATSTFNLQDIDDETPVLVDVITKEADLQDVIIPINESLHLLPSTPVNSIMDKEITNRFKNISIAFRDLISEVSGSYDYIILDCAPAYNPTNTAALCASDRVILPVAPDKFSKMGVTQTLNEITELEKAFGLTIPRNILFTKFDAREFTSLKYLTEIAEEHSDIMLKTMIRTAADVKNAISKKEDLYEYKKSNAKDDYDALTREIMGLDKIIPRKEASV